MSNISGRKWHTLVEEQVYFLVTREERTREAGIRSLREFDEEFFEIMNRSTKPLVHVINYPLNPITPPVSEFARMKSRHHSRLGYAIHMGVETNPILNPVFEFVARAIGIRFGTAATLQDACEFLLRKDPSLPPLSTWTLPTILEIQALRHF